MGPFFLLQMEWLTWAPKQSGPKNPWGNLGYINHPYKWSGFWALVRFLGPTAKAPIIGGQPHLHARNEEPLISGQIISTSHDLTPKGSLVGEIPLFQVFPGW